MLQLIHESLIFSCASVSLNRWEEVASPACKYPSGLKSISMVLDMYLQMSQDYFCTWQRQDSFRGSGGREQGEWNNGEGCLDDRSQLPWDHADEPWDRADEL